MPPENSPQDNPLLAADARLASLRNAVASADGRGQTAIADTMNWLNTSATPEERDAVLRTLLNAYAAPPTDQAPVQATARTTKASHGSTRHEDLLHDTWSQLGGASEDVNLERLAGVARAACFAFLMDIDEFAANLYSQLNLDQALLEGSLRERIAEYLNKDGDADPEELLRLIQRRRTAVLYLMHLAGTAGWIFWQDIVRDQLAPDRLESDGATARPGKHDKAAPNNRAWSNYRDRYEGLNQKEQLEALWLETARGQLSRLFGHKNSAGV